MPKQCHQNRTVISLFWVHPHQLFKAVTLDSSSMCKDPTSPQKSTRGYIKVECVCVSVYSNCNKSYNTMTSMYLCTSMTISRLPWKSSKLICGNMSDEEVSKFWVRRCSYWIEYHHMQKVMKQLCGEQPFHSLSNAHRISVIFKKKTNPMCV